MSFVPINRVWKLYLKRQPNFALFCDSLPVWGKSYFWDRKLPGGVFWRYLPKESTWYLLRRDRGEVTTSGQTVSFYSIRCVKVEHIFMNIFWLYFWGDFPKMAMESSIIGLHSYIIPHFKANMSWYASVSQQRLFLKRVLCEYRFNRSNVTNWKSDFRKNRAIP